MIRFEATAPCRAVEVTPVIDPGARAGSFRLRGKKPRRWIGAGMTAMLAVGATPTDGQEPPATRGAAVTVPAGSVLILSLGQELSTRVSRVGDGFEAVVREAVRVSGRVAIPAGARVAGLVTAVQTGSDELSEVLKIAVSTLSIGGVDYSITATVSRVDPRPETSADSTRPIAKGGAATPAGATPGRVIGGSTGSTLIDAAVGAAAGTAVILGSRIQLTVLPAGSELEITLEKPLFVNP